MRTGVSDIAGFVLNNKPVPQPHPPDKVLQLNTLSAGLMGQLTANTLLTLIALTLLKAIRSSVII